MQCIFELARFEAREALSQQKRCQRCASKDGRAGSDTCAERRFEHLRLSSNALSGSNFSAERTKQYVSTAHCMARAQAGS